MISKHKMDMKWKLAFTMISVTAILTMHELIEYSLDIFFDLKLQGVFIRDLGGIEKLNIIQTQIDDTMIDLILGIAGTLTFGLFKWKTHSST